MDKLHPLNHSITKITWLLSWLMLSPLAGFGQADSSASADTIIIRTVDDNFYEGIIVEQGSQSIVLQTLDNESVNIPLEHISAVFPWTNDLKKRRKLFRVPSLRELYYYPNYHRHMITGNFIQLEGGKGYVSNTLLTALGLRMAITDEFSIDIGLEPISFLLTNTPRAFAMATISPKITIRINELWHVGGTLSYTTNLDRYFTGAGDYAIGQLGATYGNRAANITASTGWLSKDGKVNGLPIFTLSGIVRTGPSRAFFMDNGLIPVDINRYTQLLSIGFRNDVGKRVGNKRASFGMAFIYAPFFISGEIPIFPLFDISLELNNHPKGLLQ